MLKPAVVLLAAALALAGCAAGRNPLLVKRSPCPAVAVMANTGDVTLFSPAGSRDADAIDVVATITNVRATCGGEGDPVISNASYDVLARRNSAGGARDVTFPVFAAVVRGGDRLVSKQTGQVTIHFADGQLRAQASGTASTRVQRAAADLPAEVQTRIYRKRKAKDADAAIDPLANPAARAAVKNASFELLVGFQLDEAALAYNVTK